MWSLCNEVSEAVGVTNVTSDSEYVLCLLISEGGGRGEDRGVTEGVECEGERCEGEGGKGERSFEDGYTVTSVIVSNLCNKCVSLLDSNTIGTVVDCNGDREGEWEGECEGEREIEQGLSVLGEDILRPY